MKHYGLEFDEWRNARQNGSILYSGTGIFGSCDFLKINNSIANQRATF